MWTDRQFCERARQWWPEYIRNYAWGFSQQARTHGYRGDQEIIAGLRMYRSASSGALMLLLGDAKLRTDKDLAFDFGFASASGSDDQKLIDEVDALRKEIAGTTSDSAIPVLGSGSILSEQNWTALVNDSFVLGGSHKRMEFHLALQDFENFDQGLQKKRQVFGNVAPQYSAARMRTPEHFQQKWKVFLIANPEILWNGSQNCPRVFARELIGLQAFGYTPDFNQGGIGFSSGFGAGSADFMRYFTALREAGFPANNRARILSSISAFLFGDAKALN
jgi:hypothetical protein